MYGSSQGLRLKHKIGEKTSHSYWSWTHGPRWTAHGSFGKRSWWWRSSRRSILPPAGCRDRVSWQPRSWNRSVGRIEGRYRPKGGSGGDPQATRRPPGAAWLGAAPPGRLE